MKQIALCLNAFVVLLALSGCGPSGDSKTTNGTSSGGVSTDKKPQSDDNTIVAAVKAAFAKDPVIAKETIDVTVKDGRVVLTGTVSNDAVRSKADEVARSVPEVFGVSSDKLITK